MENLTAEKTSKDGGNDENQQKIKLLNADYAKMCVKIPDVVQEINKFDGEPLDLLSWIDYVDYVFDMFSKFKDTYEYQVILKSMRWKIVGEANLYLFHKGTTLSWKCIKEDLKEHFMERFDLMTFTFKLNRLQRKNDSIDQFHMKIIHLLRMIETCIRFDPEYKGHEDVVIKLHIKMGLEVFMRGFGSPLCFLLRAHKPKDLMDAYSFVVTYVVNH